MTLPWLLVLALAQIAGASPGAATSPETATIRGRVTDKDSGAPIARAVVRLGRHDKPESKSASTDSDGRFEFADLPPGRYSGLVTAGAHRATHIMVGLFRNERGGSVVLRPGEVRANVDVALVRALAIAVRVVDEWGAPLSRVRVVAESTETGNPVAESMLQGTDDRGRKRLFEMPPGRYIVCAEWSSLYSITPIDQPNAERFLRTCYPSAATDDEAEIVRLEHRDIDGLEIRMRRGRTYTISGTIYDADGTPAPEARVAFERLEPYGSSSTSIRLAGGNFSAHNLVPGDYAIDVRVGGADSRRAEAAAFEPVTIGDADVTGLAVRMATTVDVAGHFILEGDTAVFPKPLGSGLMVSARLANDRLRGQGSAIGTTAAADRTFRLQGMFGSRRLTVANVPRGWYVKSIRYGDKDITGGAIEFKGGPDAPQLEIALSNRGATVTGRVTDARGEAVRGARVFLVPAEPSQWNLFFDYVTAAADGTFRAGPNRPGDYVLIAFAPGSRMPDFREPIRTAKMLEAGERVTLGAFEERTFDLTAFTADR